MTWTVFGYDVRCGSCGQVVLALDAVCLVGRHLSEGQKLRRCATCAKQHGYGDPPRDEIALERFRLERDKAAREANAEPHWLPPAAHRVDPREVRRPRRRERSRYGHSEVDRKVLAAGVDR